MSDISKALDIIDDLCTTEEEIVSLLNQYSSRILLDVIAKGQFTDEILMVAMRKDLDLSVFEKCLAILIETLEYRQVLGDQAVAELAPDIPETEDMLRFASLLVNSKFGDICLSSSCFSSLIDRLNHIISQLFRQVCASQKVASLIGGILELKVRGFISRKKPTGAFVLSSMPVAKTK